MEGFSNLTSRPGAPMSQAPISPLRRRMIEDMTVRGFGEKTQSDYIRHVKNFTIFLGRSPDQAQPEDLRLYQLHQREHPKPFTKPAARAAKKVVGSWPFGRMQPAPITSHPVSFAPA